MGAIPCSCSNNLVGSGLSLRKPGLLPYPRVSPGAFREPFWTVSTLLQSPPSNARREYGFVWPLPLWQVVALSGITLWLYWTTVIHLVKQWWHDPNFSHGFIVPLFSAYIVWQERDRLRQRSEEHTSELQSPLN